MVSTIPPAPLLMAPRTAHVAERVGSSRTAERKVIMKTKSALLAAILGLFVATTPAVAADSDIPRTADG